MSDTLDFEPLPSSVRSARLFVVDRLQEWRCDDLVDKVALLTSELATNAVVHTGQPYSVTVERRGPGVRVEVADRTDELPHVPDVIDLDAVLAGGGHPLDAPDAGDAGRWFSGLGIVDRTASSWGAETLPGPGKIVWFEVMGSDAGEGERRPAVSDLSDLRNPGPSGSADAEPDAFAAFAGAAVPLAPAAPEPRRLRTALVVAVIVILATAIAIAVVWYGH